MHRIISRLLSVLSVASCLSSNTAAAEVQHSSVKVISNEVLASINMKYLRGLGGRGGGGYHYCDCCDSSLSQASSIYDAWKSARRLKAVRVVVANGPFPLLKTEVIAIVS